MDAILAPLQERKEAARTAWGQGFAQLARMAGAALGEGPAVSRRTEVFRALPAEPLRWLLATFPTYLQNPRGEAVALAAHQEEFWRWLWAMRPGVGQRTFIAIWPRAGGKSTSLELGLACLAYFGLRRYVLYICATQRQANDHLANVATLLEGLGIERAINKYGFSRGWAIDRLRTKEGFTADAIGLDTAMRGVRMDEFRPDGIFLDELDEQLDTAATIDKKIDILTRAILPTGDAALAVAGVQNLPNTDGVFAQLADGRAEFLMDRYVSGPHPSLVDLPEQDWYEETVVEGGSKRWSLPRGEPVWAGQDRAQCEALLNTIGPRAFAIECLHRVQHLGGRVLMRTWFRLTEDWPRGAVCVRYWDFAATDAPGPRARGRAADPDWTVGLLMAMWQGQFWVLDVQRLRATPQGVEALVMQTARLDGPGVEIWLEEEGGASGKAVTAQYRLHVLAGYTVRTWHVTGTKGDRIKPLAAAAEAGNVALLVGAWNSAFLEEVHHVGEPGWHDDQVDAATGAHYALTLGRTLLPSDFSLRPALEGMTQRKWEARAQTAVAIPAGLARRWGLEELEDVL